MLTVRIKLQPEQGWVLTGRYKGRNVNVICFAFLKELFRHLSRSSSALSGSERLGKSLVWWRYRGCMLPGSWETCPHALANPRCRVSGAQTSSPRGGQEPGMEIPQRCRVLRGSGPCSAPGMAANCHWQTQATKGWLVPHLPPALFCRGLVPQEGLDRTQVLSAHPLARSGACP